MNKRYLVLIATGAAFATIFAAGCAAQKRVKPVTSVPVIISSASTQVTATRHNATEATTQKVVTVFREAQTEATTEETETEATTTTAKPTAKPTNKPTAKPTAKPTKKPTKKPTAKPTKKPTTKPTTKATVKANTLAAAPKNDTNANQLTGIYNGAWSQITVDATNVNNVKLTVTIHDQDDPNKTSVWKMGGKLNTSTGTLIYSNCTKTNFTYDADGSIVSKNVAYSNGQGKVVINNGMITWNDYQEHAADDMTFISAASHDHRG